jgi:DNA-directed RNA polymerase specialized sigma24 family protein
MRYARAYPAIGLEEFLSEANLALWQGALTFNPTIGLDGQPNLRSWPIIAHRRIEGACRSLVRTYRKRATRLDRLAVECPEKVRDTPSPHEQRSQSPLAIAELGDLLGKARAEVEQVNPEIWQAIVWHYRDSRTCREIGILTSRHSTHAGRRIRQGLRIARGAIE